MPGPKKQWARTAQKWRKKPSRKGQWFPLNQPSTMVEDHRAGGHVPYRSWCPACVRGRGRSFQHHLLNNTDELVPAISIDYGFFGGQEVTSAECPVIVAKDRKSKRIWSHPVPAKGVHPYAVKCLLEVLNQSGYKKVILTSDQDAPLPPLVASLARKANEEWHGEVILESSPKGREQEQRRSQEGGARGARHCPKSP